MAIVLHIAPLDRIITVRLVLLVLLHKSGMGQNVLIDVILGKYGMSHHSLVFAPMDSFGMDMLVLYAPVVRLGILTHNLANAPCLAHGMVSLVSSAQEEESTITSPINANAQPVRPTTVTSVLSTAPLANSTTKH